MSHAPRSDEPTGDAPTSGAPAAPSPAGFSRMVRLSAVYAVGNLVVKASGLLLAAMHLNKTLLPFAQYGVYGMAQAYALVLVPLLGMGIPAGLLRFSTAADLSDADRRALPGTALGLVAASVALGLALVWPFCRWLAAYLFGEASPVGVDEGAALFRMALVYAAFKVVGTVPTMRLQVQERAGTVAAVAAVEMAVLLASTFVALVVLRRGLTGAMEALVVSGAASLGASLLAARFEGFAVRRHLARRLVRYGLPLVVVVLSLPLLQAGDRFVLGKMAPGAQLSLYEAAGRLAGILNVVLVQAFQQAFSVAGMKAIGQGEGARLHDRTFRHVCVVGAGVVVGLSTFVYDALALLAPSTPEYLRAAPLVLPLATGYVFYALYVVAANVLYAHDRTRAVTGGVLAALAVNMALNVVLIPPLGAMGAALATLLAYGLLAVATMGLAQRLGGFRFAWGLLARTLALATALGLAGLWLNALPASTRLAGHAGVMLLYPLGVLAVGTYRWDEVRTRLHALAARRR